MATKTTSRTVYFQHNENGAVHGYDEEFLAAAFASLDMPPHLKAKQKKKHPLEEIAIQIRRRVILPCDAPAVVPSVEVPGELVEAALAKERELGKARRREELEEALRRMDAGEDVRIPEHLLTDGDYVPATAAVVVPEPAEPRGPAGIADGEATPAPMAGAPGVDLPFADDLTQPPTGAPAGPQDAKPRRRVRAQPGE